MSELVKVVQINGVDYLLVEEVKKPELEFRLYYDDLGKVLFYTCDKPEGNFIVVDKQTFVEARHDWLIVDGKLTRHIPGIIIHKLKPSTTGINCASDDVSIVTDNEDVLTQKWQLSKYELR